MPLIYQHQINQSSRLGVWHITEPEAFFLQKVPLERTITHPHKRLQHLAGRWLLTELVPGFPYHLIRIAGTRKPFLAGDAWHFSLSHCGVYAAAIVSRDKRVGVDVEQVSEKVARVQHKFLTAEELELIAGVDGGLEAVDRSQDGNHQLLTACWSIKEALFKWDGAGETDFKKHLRIDQMERNGQEGTACCRFLKTGETLLKVHFLFFNGNCLSWVVS